jgi:hypothetical protein
MSSVLLSRAAGAWLLCVSLAACSAADVTQASPAGSSPAPAVSATSDPAAGRGIPSAALLQPQDLQGAEGEPLEQGELAYVRPLRPCGDDPYPSDDTRTDAIAFRFVIYPTAGTGAAPAVVTEFIGRHAPGGAAEQFDEVSAALKRCPGGLGKGERRWTVLDTGLAGDESVLVRIDQKVSYADEEPSVVGHYAALARSADVIVTVTDLGWENTGGSEKLVRDLLGKAVERSGAIS